MSHHSYSFLIGTPPLSKSSGSNFFRFYTTGTFEKTLKDAVAKVYSCLTDPSVLPILPGSDAVNKMNPEKNGFNKWFEEESGLDEDATGEEILDALRRRALHDPHYPWLVAYKVDNKLIDCNECGIEEEINRYQSRGDVKTLNRFIDFLCHESGIVDFESWGIEFPKGIKLPKSKTLKIAYGLGDDEDDSEGYTPTPAAIKKFFRGNPKYFNKAAKIIADWYEDEDSAFGEYAFESKEDFYDRAYEDIGELIDAADGGTDRAIATLAYDHYYRNTTLEEFLADEE